MLITKLKFGSCNTQVLDSANASVGSKKDVEK
jgi:hypothetical protein